MHHAPAPQAARPFAHVTKRLARLFTRTPEAKASRAGPLIALTTGRGEPVWAPRDYATFAREGMMQNAIVYRSVRMIAECAASVPLLLYEGDHEIIEHPMLDLLARPSPGMTGTDLMESFFGFLLVSGNAYIEAAGMGGELRELHALRPDRMKVIPGPDGWPEAWEYEAGGAKIRITGEPAPSVRAVLHLKLFHPANDHYGLSPIEAAASSIDLHNAAARWNKALLDNSARPSGALVYSSGQHMTAEQFERLKGELEASFQGTRNAGRPLLLEGGLDWKAMSLSPRDLDFMEARHAAAREIALAIGVPPMLLGIPGDNTYANYAEANRAFWRQTVLPLVQRTARAMSLWLSPAWGADLRLEPDLDKVEALSPERDALWNRLERASFLTEDEKRAAAGYDTKTEGGDSTAVPFVNKYNPHHDDRGRFTFAPEGPQVAQSTPRGGRSGRRRDPTLPDASPGQQVRLSASEARAKEALRRVQELDPAWRPTPSISEGVEGRIAENIARAREAEAKLAELLPKGFGSYENHAKFGENLRSGFAAAGYTDTVPMIRGSSVTGQSFRTGRPFDSDPNKPSDYDVAISSPSLMQRSRELGIELRGGGTRTEPLNEQQIRSLGLHQAWRDANRSVDREVNFMVYDSVEAITRRGPNRSIPDR